ncbi:hypothetical protein BDV37DRAFT_291961 [Aspergillus pseudonomiae]|uniref:C2H2-type domain-containing protein n=1 Tax=Aspergillus pseudonomiae TaxID=1506151 RepID=A0A5N7CTJ8_9EURO|nr:uncharacterized protein BDV37DRAFT_291961 [Aspergillus pseudonomiae]KAE8397492.1 hypothetical protein BDV37DRAFT_291961 [Aspergillus pseudonomiae]
MGASALRGSRKKTVLSPEHYRQHRRDLENTGVFQKRHAKSTKNNIKGCLQWTGIRHCDFLGEHRLKFLVAARKEDVMIFLKWILDNYAIKKFSSLHENWRQWCQLYRQAVGRSLHTKCRSDINDYMTGTLVPLYNLDLSVGDKPVMNVDDLYLVLHHHWVLDRTPYPDGRQIIQLAFLLLVSAYTASRPGALVYVERNERTNISHFYGRGNNDNEGDEEAEWDTMSEDLKTLCYGQISLILLPNPHGPRDHLVMEIDLKHTKGHLNKPKRKIFLMSEVKESVFDIIILVIVMAILDDAFESNIRSVEEVFSSRVLAPRRSNRLKFRKDKLNVPVCRQPISTGYGTRTHDMKPLKYHTYLYYLQRLNLAVGMIQAMRPYDLRRGTGEAVDSVASLPLLQQVMGHAYASVYQKYMNQRVQCHVQAAFLGIPSENALMNILSHQSRYVDPRAPAHFDDLTSTQRASISSHPEIIRLRELRDSLAAEAKELYGSSKNAAGTKIGELKAKADANLRCAKAKLKKEAFNAARGEFFDTIDTKEINKQLDPSFIDVDDNEYRPESVVHKLEERRRIAQMMKLPTKDLSEKEALDHRLALANALIDLGLSSQPDKDPSSPEPRASPIALTNKHCLFCVFSPHHQCYFSTSRKAREHFETHLRAFGREEPISCPDEFCQLVLHGHQELKSHADQVHKVRYFTEAQRIRAGF